MIMPGITIGPDSAIGANTTVESDIPRNTFAYGKGEVSNRNWEQ
jgi:acetyltransferase-like isoleucine patch superfamily enzyme